MIIVIDFGSQYTHLICRRIRESGVSAEILSYTEKLPSDLDRVSGFVLSGSPASLWENNSPRPDPAVFGSGKPVLGICYGMQVMAAMLGGKVERKDNREYGEARLTVSHKGSLFNGLTESFRVWMSHYDRVSVLPAGFKTCACTRTIAIAGMSDEKRRLYGIQFHPEVAHTEYGRKILSNFIFRICRSPKNWDLSEWIELQVKSIRRSAGKGKVIMALSGGVDSGIASVLIKKALGKRFFPVFVDHGLTRIKDRKKIKDIFIDRLGLDVKIVDCEDVFLKALKGVRDPEKKRKIIGRLFIKVFMDEARRITGITHLVQGTLYPDVIESARAGTSSAVIKTHHNVGGLPSKMKLKLIEPFRMLYKDEVRDIGRKLGVPEAVINQHPFPGPGLGIRIIGAVNKKRIDILRKADVIIEEELKKAGLYYKLWQAFGVFLPVRTVGVMGDKRTHENVIALRFVRSVDAMTAQWARIPHKVLSDISTRIVNDVHGINRVVYDITNKPPGTIEWE
ncbi:glutamine-hydrolyzing GMP synthase [Elusimicrobiota bacterium]